MKQFQVWKSFLFFGFFGAIVLTSPFALAEFDSQEMTSASEMGLLNRNQNRFRGMMDLSYGKETWIEGETIRYLLASFRDQNSSPLVALLDQLNGVRLSRDEKRLFITIEYPKALRIRVRPFANTPTWQLYGLVIPKVSKFSVEANDGVIELRELEVGDSPSLWQIQVNMPFLPDSIYMRKARLDLVNGDISVGAGFLDNVIAIVAEAKIRETDFTYLGISFWQSVLESLRITRWFGVE